MENKFPKNVRQIGNVSDTPKIYVEDYVDTFLNQICEHTEEMPVGVFLIGHTVRQDEQDCIYVSGALRMTELCFDGKHVGIHREVWEEAQREKEAYFPDGEIIGWCVIQSGGILQLESEMRRVHEKYFNYFGTVLILKNPEDEQYFTYKYKELMRMNGHYIYYEKNAAMQNYMILERKKIGVTPSEDVEDKAAKEFRNIVKERIIIQEEKRHTRYMRAVSALLIIAVLGIGVTTVNNYGKMQALQSALDGMKDSAVEKEESTEKEVVETSGEVAEEVPKTDAEVTGAPEEAEETAEGATEPVNEEAQMITSTMQEMSEDVYIVEAGDTLAKISKKVYGDISHVDAICRMNGLSDGNLIFIGQKLLLP